jgi:hypothetical protein
MVIRTLPRKIDHFDRGWNYDAINLRDMIALSPSAVSQICSVSVLGQFRGDLPLEA